jgi:threonyl-tRNA synthetase
MIHITLPDGTIKDFPEKTTPYDIALSISEGLARNVLAAVVDDKTVALNQELTHDAHVRLLTWNDPEGKAVFWHSSAHLMAAAIEELYPGVKFGIGPSIETGFYYDIDFMDYQISSDDFPKIEAKMAEIVARKEKFVRKEVSKQEALDFFTKKNDEYKVELIRDLEDGTITFYQSGNYTDLCRGPHLVDTAPIKALKLLNTAGAYWRGDEKRKQLTRIYGVTFPKKKELDEYLTLLEEAKKRDHRKLGKELELFMFSDMVGKGLPIWLPNGTALRLRLEDFLKKIQKHYGYQQVMTPHIGNKALYVTSGHWDHYGKDSFQPITTPEEGEMYLLKPMNCPHHCMIFKNSPRSYKDLPLRIAEFGTVYRYEQSGELHGLTRVRSFTQDDAHIFCRQDQVKQEFIRVMEIIEIIFKALKFENFEAQISLRDPNNTTKYVGSDEVWALAEQAIIDACKEKNLPAKVEYGEAAFYGPKLDFMVKDAIGRRWQLGTIQVDYNLPERFDLEYVGEDNKKHRPVMIHRAPFGSMERFVAVLLEHTGGNFPLWLTPNQAIILPISEKYQQYAEEVMQQLSERDIRVTIDDRNEKAGRKIRDAEVSKVPFMIIVGEKEEQNHTVSVREHGVGDQGAMSVDDFIALINNRINDELAR